MDKINMDKISITIIIGIILILVGTVYASIDFKIPTVCDGNNYIYSVDFDKETILCREDLANGSTSTTEHYLYFSSGITSLTLDSQYIGVNLVSTTPYDTSFYIPEINITEFSCIIEQGGAGDQAEFRLSDEQGNLYGLICTTLLSGQTCINNSHSIIINLGFLTIDFEELAGTTSGHGQCWIKYKVM